MYGSLYARVKLALGGLFYLNAIVNRNERNENQMKIIRIESSQFLNSQFLLQNTFFARVFFFKTGFILHAFINNRLQTSNFVFQTGMYKVIISTNCT